MFDAMKQMKVTVPIALLAGLLWLGWSAEDLTVSALTPFFVTKAEAQTIGGRIGELEGKIGGLDSRVEGVEKKIDAQRVKQIEQEVFDLRTQQCMEIGTPIGALRLERIANLITEWRSITGSSGTPTSFVDCGSL